MSLVSVLLYPLVLLWPSAAVSEPQDPAREVASAEGVTRGREVWDAGPLHEANSREGLHLLGEATAAPLSLPLAQGAGPRDARQVRIERRMTIRITPRAPMHMPPDMLVAMPEGRPGHEIVERKMGDCVPVRGIAGVQPERGNRLLLYMRDRRVVSAQLERSCRAKDFYSGFYLSHSNDGKLCVNRDKLLARSGMNCKLTRIRQLVEVDD
ncbi:hypothetical protein I5E68_07925 [Novosphingobium sp. YJ-S2-02]|uniref:Uncharacterized protein n=1 Tax=Novosphingobium aureum TaxID=2792964 RepID=A0A931HBQ6_9SPHN|nr:hypothetical protein [Novosphingobium aureum]MBH0112877.1 hypothetical protein [Novosphingobium aureum]